MATPGGDSARTRLTTIEQVVGEFFERLKNQSPFVLGPYPLVKRKLHRPQDQIIGSDRWEDCFTLQFQSP